MTNQNKMNSKNLIVELLDSITPEESLRIENRMLMAAKIDDAINAKGWKKKDLMKALGKTNQSEVTKWLSGTHNFTQDLLTDLGRVLNVDFLNLEKKCPVKDKQVLTNTYVFSVNTRAPKPTYINDILVSCAISNDSMSDINFYIKNN